MKHKYCQAVEETNRWCAIYAFSFNIKHRIQTNEHEKKYHCKTDCILFMELNKSGSDIAREHYYVFCLAVLRW